MKFARLLAVGTVFAFMAACGDDASSGSSTSPDEDSSSSVCEDCDESNSSVKSSSSVTPDSVPGSQSSSSAKSSSSKNGDAGIESGMTSSSSEDGDAGTSSSAEPGSSSTVEEQSSSSGSQELDIRVSGSCKADYPVQAELQIKVTKAYMQADSSGRYSGSLWYVVESCQRLGGTLSKTVSGDTLLLEYVDVQASSYCLCWSDYSVSYGPEFENLKYIDFYASYGGHSVYEIIDGPDPGKPPMPSSSSSMSFKENLSSMYEERSSSSATSSGSNVVVAAPCKTETEDNCEYGVLTDNRDGLAYKTVKIGKQMWMAENLNYESENSYCYNDSVEYCAKYGRLYTWAAAMDSVGRWSTNGKGCGYNKTCTPTYPVRGVCPEGWHLPSTVEIETLIDAVGGYISAGKKLKSTSGWKWNEYDDLGGNGTDCFGFSALPVGDYYYNNYSHKGDYVDFWSSIEVNDSRTYQMHLMYYDDGVYEVKEVKSNGFPVRCVKDK